MKNNHLFQILLDYFIKRESELAHFKVLYVLYKLLKDI